MGDETIPARLGPRVDLGNFRTHGLAEICAEHFGQDCYADRDVRELSRQRGFVVTVSLGCALILRSAKHLGVQLADLLAELDRLREQKQLPIRFGQAVAVCQSACLAAGPLTDLPDRQIDAIRARRSQLLADCQPVNWLITRHKRHESSESVGISGRAQATSGLARTLLLGATTLLQSTLWMCCGKRARCCG